MIAQSRRCAMDLARQQNLTDQKQGRLGLIVTELGTNLLKHGNGGELFIDTFDDRDGHGIEILALDKGSGITDINRALQDGYSTANSPGTGLGAVNRFADVRIVSRYPVAGQWPLDGNQVPENADRVPELRRGGRAVEGAHFETGVICNHREPCGRHYSPRLEQGVLKQAFSDLLDLGSIGHHGQLHGIAAVIGNLSQFAQLAGVFGRDRQNHPDTFLRSHP